MAAICLKDAGLADAADRAFRSLTKDHPTYFTGWSLYGVALKNAGRFEEAVAALRQALAVQDHIETRNTLVVSLYKAGRLDEAIEEGRRNLTLKDHKAVEQFRARSAPAPQLGPMGAPFSTETRKRNIISFSLWGDNPIYVRGAIINARIAPHIYLGWTARFYCDSSVPSDAIRDIKAEGAQVVMVDDPELMRIRPMWRFLVSDDPDVDWFICRDADSRLNCQELLAVEDWLRSGQPFHVMRDHIYHMELILAGMWGGAAGVLPNLRALLVANNQYFDNRFGDQAFLMDEIWPIIRNHTLVHDTYYRFNGARDFPDAYRLPRPVHVGGAVKVMNE
ncbi:hypothetical protein [Rhodospirillum sp. A1_3_36]|uniref:hypothetical protein n=1 Tax=Rhodospirillum sp. A1_3_36 TaxID=3391666 RepID=UPI0039A51022